jgi:hypothetical protein
MTIEDGTHSGSRNVVRKFILHTVQNLQNQKSVLMRSAHKWDNWCEGNKWVYLAQDTVQVENGFKDKNKPSDAKQDWDFVDHL